MTIKNKSTLGLIFLAGITLSINSYMLININKNEIQTQQISELGKLRSFSQELDKNFFKNKYENNEITLSSLNKSKENIFTIVKDLKKGIIKINGEETKVSLTKELNYGITELEEHLSKTTILEEDNKAINEHSKELVDILSKDISKDILKLKEIYIVLSLLNILMLFSIPFFLKNLILNRLEKLKEISEKIVSTKNFSLRIDHIDKNDEISNITAAINSMIKTVDDLFEKQKEDLNKIEESRKDSLQKAEESIFYTNIGKELSKNTTTGLVTLQKKLEISVEDINHINTINNNNSQIAEKVSEEIKNINTSIHEVSENITNTEEITEELHFSVKDISKIIELIKSISEQTNLLALNAAIEASKAGENGKGFAVVADEVRKLAEKTSAATAEIEDSIEILEINAENINKIFISSKEKNNKTEKVLEELNQSLEELLQANEKIKEDNTELSKSLFSNLIELDHMVYKTSIYDALFKSESGNEIGHTNCRFGKWQSLDLTQHKFRTKQQFVEMTAPHELVHAKGKEIRDLISEKKINLRKEDVKKILEQMESASLKFTKLFEDLNRAS